MTNEEQVKLLAKVLENLQKDNQLLVATLKVYIHQTEVLVRHVQQLMEVMSVDAQGRAQGNGEDNQSPGRADVRPGGPGAEVAPGRLRPGEEGQP